MTIDAIAVLMPGDMGHATGRVLTGSGHKVMTCLAGRSERSAALTKAAGLEDVGSLDAVVENASLILSILPPAAALAQAQDVVRAMERTAKTPVYVDCNAISPATAMAIADVIGDAGAPFIDAGIIGTKPDGKGPGPRFYVSGADTGPMQALDGKGFQVKPLGPEPGRASAIKMCYAGLTKGTWTLQTSVMLAAEAHGLTTELLDEFQYSQGPALALMEGMIPRLPADSERWIGEMEEIAKTFSDAGVTPGFHDGAAAVFRLLAETPYAAETRETIDATRTLEETVKTAAGLLSKKN